MGDLLLQLSQNRAARKVVKALGLPLPMPQVLRRATGPLEERPLQGTQVLVGAGAGGLLENAVVQTLGRAGAVVGDASAEALVFDATGLKAPPELRALYDFFNPRLPRLATGGRVVVLGRPPQTAEDSAAAATQQALAGFVRSLGREVGRKGATANLVYVEPSAHERLEGVLRFLLSSRSAFVSGQVLTVAATAAAKGEVRCIRPLEGKVALVTGAGRGIGAATARRLAAEGAHVVCLERPADALLVEQLAGELGGSVLLADVSAPQTPAALTEALRHGFGGVDIVVHNAGLTRDKTLARMGQALWDEVLAVNLTAVVATTGALLAQNLLRDHGRVICLSSVSGIAGNMGQTNYSASKAGLLGFVEREAAVLAPRGITVNAVAPGLIETRLTEAMPVMIREGARRLSNLGQGGLPEDVAETITFLATEASVGLTGGVLRVCGGAWVGA
jgi:3-oxoacyl-[acyl-carrier protein] reductase